MTDENQKQPTKILRRKSVCARTGLSRTGLYERMRNGGFPKPISLGGRSVGWVEHEVEAYLQAQIKKRR